MIAAKAALLRERGERLSVEEITFASPESKEVLVRLVAASACHSDMHVVAAGGPHLPLVVGHEAAGVVEEVGPGVDGLSVGDKVVFSFVPSCRRCRACMRGDEVACVRGSQIGGDGRPLNGTYRAKSTDQLDVGQMVRLGAFAEYTVVHQDSVQVLPPTTDLKIASLLSCGFVTGAGAAINIAAIEPGESALVVGFGGVGAAAVQGCVIAGAAQVIAVDVHDDKLKLARDFGATDTVNAATDDWVSAVLDLTGGWGVDKALTCIGTIDDNHLKDFLRCVRDVGHAVVVGAGNPQLALRDMGRKSLTWTLYGSHRPKADQLTFLTLHDAGRLRLREMISAEYSLDQVNECLGDMAEGKLIRGVIDFGSATQDA